MQIPADWFKPGDRVRVIGGTFVGLQGVVIGPDEARLLKLAELRPSLQGKFWRVLLPVFGVDTPVELATDQLARISAT